MSPESGESLTPLAVAIGRLEEKVGHLSEVTNSMDGKLDRALEDVSEVKRAQAVLRVDVDGLREREKDRDRAKPPWTAIAALTLAVPAAFAALKGWFGF